MITIEMAKGVARQAVREVVSKTTGAIDTTDATPTLLMSVDIVPPEVGIITYRVVASNSDMTATLAIERKVRYIHDGSSFSVGTEANILNVNDFTSANVAAAPSGSVDRVEVNVTGEASTDISWAGSIEKERLNIEIVLP